MNTVELTSEDSPNLYTELAGSRHKCLDLARRCTTVLSSRLLVTPTKDKVVGLSGERSDGGRGRGRTFWIGRVIE